MNKNDSFDDILNFDKRNEDSRISLLDKYIYNSNKHKEESFSRLISFLYNLFFIKEKTKDNINEIFLIQKCIMDYLYSEYNGNFFPSDFFKLLNSLFEIAKSFDSERKTKFFEKIVKLFEQGQEIYKNFILKYFNELFEILIYSKIDQNNNVKAKGMILDNIVEDNLENNNDIFDLEKFEKLLVEKINTNQPILTGFFLIGSIK